MTGLVGSLQLGQVTTILRITTIDLDMKKSMSIACAARGGRDFILFLARTRSHRAKLFSLTEKRPLTPNEILGTAEGIKLFAEWAPKTELFRRNRHGESAEL